MTSALPKVQPAFESVFHLRTMAQMADFKHRVEKLALLSRDAPEGAVEFFQQSDVAKVDLTLEVGIASAREQLAEALTAQLTPAVLGSDFCQFWLDDMAAVSIAFARLLDSETVGLRLSSKRGCQRYHMDNVPLRLLVTYYGAGTDWLPDHAADVQAYEAGMDNTDICTNESQIQSMQPWDVGVFRGAPHGLLHRTPDAAQHHAVGLGQSLLLRLDGPAFWRRVMAPHMQGQA